MHIFAPILLSITAVLAEGPPGQPGTAAGTQPTATPAPPAAPATPTPPPAVVTPADPRKLMLQNLLKAGILMLEGKAYRQFIQAFVDDEDRRRFEQAFGKNGYVDYNAWGKEKGEHMLAVLRRISLQEPVMAANRACFRAEDIPKGKFSFVFTKGSWFIENKSQCPASTVEGKPAERAKP